MKKHIITAGFVLLGIGTIAGGFFYTDGVRKSEALRAGSEKLAAMTEEISRMETHLKIFRQKSFEDERLIEKLQDELEAMTSLRSALKVTETTHDAVRRELSACNDAKASLEALLEKERTRTRTLESNLGAARDRLSKLGQTLEDKDRTLTASAAALSTLTAEKAEAEAEADRQIASLKASRAEARTRRREAEDTIQEHVKRIEVLTRSVAALEGRLQQAVDEDQRCRIDLKKLRVDNAAKDTQIAYLISEIDRIENEAARRNAQLKARIQEKEGQIEKERAQVLSLRGRIEENKKTRAFLEKRFFELHEQKDKDWIESRERSAQLEARIAEQKSLLEDKIRELDEAALLLGSARSEIVSLKADREAGTTARQNLKAELSGLKDALDAERRRHENSRAELDEARERHATDRMEREARTAEALERLSEKESRLADALAQIEALKDRAENDKAAVGSLQEELTDLNGRLRREQLEAAQRNAQLKRRIKAKEIQLEKATVQILNMRASIESAVGVRSEMAERMSDLKSRKADINQLLTQLDETIQNKNRQLEDALGEVEKWRGLYENLEASLQLRQDQMERLKKIAAQTRKEKGAMESRLQEMRSTYDDLIRELHDNLENREATIEEYQKRLTVTFVDKILFGRAAVTISREGKAVLRKTGRVFKNIQYGKIRIVGHTDSDPIRSKYRRIYPSNWELSSARAASVARFFQDETGIAPGKMEILGLAYTQPIASNETTEGKAKNRRVEIVIIPNR